MDGFFIGEIMPTERQRIAGKDIRRTDKKYKVSSSGTGIHSGLSAAAKRAKANKPLTRREKEKEKMRRKAEALREKRRLKKLAQSGTDGTKDGDINKNPVNGYQANKNYRMKKGN